MASIVTLTMNPALDESTSVEQLVADFKLRCRAPREEAGGGGINVARAVARLGGDALAVYTGGGPEGARLGELLDLERVPRLEIPIPGPTRRNWNVREETTGRQYRFIFPGPSLLEEHWRLCLETIRQLSPLPEFLVASGSLPPGVPDDFYARVAEVARELGIRFVLDASGRPLRLALEKGVFLIKPSLSEYEELTGGSVPGDSDLPEAARRLVRKWGCEAVVLSLGRAGALWSDATESERVPAPAVTAESSVGAGDAMVAGIVLSLSRRLPFHEAVRFGIAAGAAAVMNPGTQLCGREDTERLYQQMRLARV